MQDFYEDPQEVGPALTTARDRLDRFESDVLNRHVLLRLRTHSPFHPFLAARFLALGLGSITLVVAASLMAAPLLDRSLAQDVGRFDAMFSLPLPVTAGLLAGGFLLFGVGAHLAALVAGRSAPLLPHEARNHQRLVSDVKRLEAQLAVSQRLTPKPADRRVQM